MSSFRAANLAYIYQKDASFLELLVKADCDAVENRLLLPQYGTLLLVSDCAAHFAYYGTVGVSSEFLCCVFYNLSDFQCSVDCLFEANDCQIPGKKLAYESASICPLCAGSLQFQGGRCIVRAKYRANAHFLHCTRARNNTPVSPRIFPALYTYRRCLNSSIRLYRKAERGGYL